MILQECQWPVDWGDVLPISETTGAAVTAHGRVGEGGEGGHGRRRELEAYRHAQANRQALSDFEYFEYCYQMACPRVHALLLGPAGSAGIRKGHAGLQVRVAVLPLGR